MLVCLRRLRVLWGTGVLAWAAQERLAAPVMQWLVELGAL